MYRKLIFTLILLSSATARAESIGGIKVFLFPQAMGKFKVCMTTITRTPDAKSSDQFNLRSSISCDGFPAINLDIGKYFNHDFMAAATSLEVTLSDRHVGRLKCKLRSKEYFYSQGQSKNEDEFVETFVCNFNPSKSRFPLPTLDDFSKMGNLENFPKIVPAARAQLPAPTPAPAPAPTPIHLDIGPSEELVKQVHCFATSSPSNPKPCTWMENRTLE